MYTYLAGHVGRTGDQGAFRALARGYTHWSSGRLEEMDINTNHPEYCHVRCTMTPSMKSIPYHIYLYFSDVMENSLPFVQLNVNVLLGMLYFNVIHVYLLSHYPFPHIPVDQAYRHLRIVILQKVCKLYKCLLFYIALPPSLNPASFQLRPNLPPAHVGDDDTTPVTSLPCQWKCPKK